MDYIFASTNKMVMDLHISCKGVNVWTREIKKPKKLNLTIKMGEQSPWSSAV